MYEGAIKANKPDGIGKMYKSNGDLYVGYFKEGKMHG